MQQQFKQYIDQNYYSRQLLTYGHYFQQKIINMKIFIHTLNTLGTQVLKHLVLTGVKEIYLFDNKLINQNDLNKNFCYKIEDISQKLTRAQACVKYFSKMNRYCKLNIAQTDKIQYIYSHYFDCVVLLDCYKKSYLQQLNQACRSRNNKIGFILGGTLGLYGYTFVDFGKHHMVQDPQGLQQRLKDQTIFIKNISNSKQAIVQINQNYKHKLNVNDQIEFFQVQGMYEINGMRFRVEKIINQRKFIINGDTTQFNQYKDRGIALKIIKRKYIDFQSFLKTLQQKLNKSHQNIIFDAWKIQETYFEPQLVLNAFYLFFDKYQRLPQNQNQSEAIEFLNLILQQSKKRFSDNVQINQNLIRNLAKYANIQISPISTYFGGIIAQQVIKFTGLFNPICQWFHQQFYEILSLLNSKQASPYSKINKKQEYSKSQKNDYQILFGSKFIQKSQNSHPLIVGSGGLGCQIIKILALMNISTKNNVQNKKKSYILDADLIQVSNLNRQFLFNHDDIGKNKSQTACKKAKQINKDFQIQAINLNLSNQHQDELMNIKINFWNYIDFVITCVDNVRARFYIDQKCVQYERPMFQSGIEGTKCHTQIVIPHKTLTYNDIVQPFSSQQIPVKQIRSFPIKHSQTIRWSRDYFIEYFQQSSRNLFQFINKTELFQKKIKQEYFQKIYAMSNLQKILKNLQKFMEINQKLQKIKKLSSQNLNQQIYQYFIQISLQLFLDIFKYNIENLQKRLPIDHKYQDYDQLFWKGLKKYPQIVQFNSKNQDHLKFIQSTVNIYTKIFNINNIQIQQMKINKINFIQKASKIYSTLIYQNQKKIKQQKKQSGSESQINNEFKTNKTNNNQEQKEICGKLFKQLKEKIKSNNINSSILQFYPKNQQKNQKSVINFILSTSIIKANNFKISHIYQDLKAQNILFQTIPSISTTQSIAAGLIGIQIIKFILSNNKYKKEQQQKSQQQIYHKNGYINTAIPSFIFSEVSKPIIFKSVQFDPLMCGPVKAIPGEFTKWDKIDYHGPLTILQLKTQIQSKFNIKIQMICSGSNILMSEYHKKDNNLNILNMLIQNVIQMKQKKILNKNKKYFKIDIIGTVQDSEGNIMDFIMPQIRYQID